MKSHRLPTLVYNMPYPANCSDYNFSCLSLKIVKLAFHVMEMDFCLRVSATVIALPKNHPRDALF